jgi:hypothetical protein
LKFQLVEECLCSLWSAARFFGDRTFRLSVRIFFWEESEATPAQLNASPIIRFLRRRYPGIPVVVAQFDRLRIPSLTPSLFPESFPMVVAGRLALCFCLSTDLILYLDCDTQVMSNPFPALAEELRVHPGAVLLGVQDVAAQGDGAFMEPIEYLHPNWTFYQQAALYFMRNTPILRAEMRRVCAIWAARKIVLRFPEQDAMGIWFDLRLKGMMPDSLLRQWADCYDKNDTLVRLICHGRGGMEEAWKQDYTEMRTFGLGVFLNNETGRVLLA